MTKNNTAAVEFHRCSRMQWIPGALFRQPRPAIRSTPWAEAKSLVRFMIVGGMSTGKGLVSLVPGLSNFSRTQQTDGRAQN